MADPNANDDLLAALESLDDLIAERESHRAAHDEQHEQHDADLGDDGDDVPVLNDVITPGNPRLARLRLLETELDRLVAERLAGLREQIRREIIDDLRRRYPQLL